MDRIRLQKYFTDSGVMSRRKCEEAILDGRITVNSLPAELGMKVLPGVDRVFLDGREIVYTGAVRRTYIMLNKPMGYVTTAHDEKGRRNAVSLVADCGKRVYPVGRLDMYSEGLLLLTDDGELANRLTHPSAGFEKVYRLTVKGEHGEAFCASFCSVTELDGYSLAPVGCRYIGRGEITKDKKPTDVYEVTLREGRNRQIRRMCEKIGVKVVRLCRISVGSLSMGNLETGRWRYLTDSEISLLKGK